MNGTFKKLALGLALAPAVALAGCAYDDYGYGGASVGYGYGGYDPWYDGYYGYPSYGWYDGFYYPGHGYWLYDRSGNRHRWSDDQRRHWEGRRDRDHAGNWQNRPDRPSREQWRNRPDRPAGGEWRGRQDGDRSGWRQDGARPSAPQMGAQAAPAPAPRVERPSGGGGMRGWAARSRGRDD